MTHHIWPRALLTVLSLVACTLGSAPVLRAQDTTIGSPRLDSLLMPGRKVRLHLTTDRRVTGRIVAATDSSVTFAACATCRQDTVRFVDIAGVDTLAGPPHRVRHAVVGAFVGGGLLVSALAVAGTQADRSCHDGPCGLWVLAVPPAFGLGALVGGITGALLPADRWSPSSFRYPASTPSM